MMNKYAVIDDRNFPEVMVTFTGEQPTDENFTLYLQEVKNQYEEEKRIALIFDATKAVSPGKKYQKQQADWLKDNDQLMRDYCKGTAYVMPNPLMRLVLKGIFAFQQQPVPYKVVKSIEDARTWFDSVE